VPGSLLVTWNASERKRVRSVMKKAITAMKIRTRTPSGVFSVLGRVIVAASEISNFTIY
jgi:hypothetical protein